MGKRKKSRTVVIAGASSGIGRATALRFAREGWRVVVAARREHALDELARQCEEQGAEALAVPTDVTDVAAVERLADTAWRRFGEVDMWVNNAGVSLFSWFDDAPPDQYRRVIETDLFGTVNGARAALSRFRRQGHGVLVNTASITARLPQPYASAYVVSKHGVKALGESLRQELWLRGEREIHVCTVMPAAIDTPFFQHAANRTGRGVKALPPVYPADKVAKTIVGLAARPRREVVVGRAGRLLYLQWSLAPGRTERLLARLTDRQHLTDEPAPASEGNLFRPMQEGTEISGGWRAPRPSLTRPAAAAALLGAAAAAGWLVLRPQRGRR